MSTLAHKVERHEIDLQPDFQRGQVWSEAKRRKLIDTILRGWYVPAVHLVVNDELDIEEVLDGQQRLQSILSFMNDEFPVDGTAEPSDANIELLDGLRYSQLPDSVRSRFKRYPITTVRLRDYNPDEPGELFFRLNQLTALTAAEQRNALVGEPRNQIKRLASDLTSIIGEASIGFSNSRMNYDDVMVRLAVSLEINQLSAKVTATRLERRYRSNTPFDVEIINRIYSSIHILRSLIEDASDRQKLNKASLFSWLFFLIDTDGLYSNQPAIRHEIFNSFEQKRSRNAISSYVSSSILEGEPSEGIDRAYQAMASIFNDRSSSRVNDSTSILLRDMCINAHAYFLTPPTFYEQLDQMVLLRQLDEIAFELMHFPTAINETVVLESELAGRWEQYRATRSTG